MSYRIFAINPGSTSTKIAMFEGEKCIFSKNVAHDASELAKYPDMPAQLPYRRDMILDILKEQGLTLEGMDAFVLMNNTVTRFRMEDFTSGVLLDYGVDMNGWWILGIGTLLLFGVSLLRERGVDVRGRLLSLPVPVRYVLLLGLCTLTVAWFVGSDVAAGSFMYAVF